MNLSERKKKILQIVVDDYINTAVPVSSKSITDNYMTDISSATVRSELSALEELGFLCQLHTSSGRVPSPLAYKFYVEELMQKHDLSEKEIEYIQNTFNKKTDDLEYIIKNVTKVISDLTNYTSVAITNFQTGEIIKNIGLFKYREGQSLLLILTNIRLLRDNIIDIPIDMTTSEIENASKVLNKLFEGKELGQISEIEEEVLREFKEYKEVFGSVMEALKEYNFARKGEVMLEGEDKIFSQPEYTDVERVKNFLSIVTSKEKVANILKENGNDIEINVKIGNESGEDIPKDCSLVTATYSVGGVKLGKYGVFGPIRMDYQKVITVLENVGKILENIINNK
jgi:heat-inducible transcriptional repressor